MEIKRAVPIDRGTEIDSAIKAIVTVPNKTAATPKVWVSGDQDCSVKNERPATSMAVKARNPKKRPTASMIPTVNPPLLVAIARKIVSTLVDRDFRTLRVSPFLITGPVSRGESLVFTRDTSPWIKGEDLAKAEIRISTGEANF
jgi:hypothetical protein